MKTTLTIEESTRLIKLGVDANKASEIEYRPKKSGYGRIGYRVYSLADLLSILPKEIDGRDLGMEYDSEFEQWCVGYNCWYLQSSPELIDALNQLLIWCLEQGHCKCGKGGER